MIWFCAYTDRCGERAVAMRLRQEAQLMAYLPIEPIVRKARGQRSVSSRPLIPRHVFFGTPDPTGATFATVRALRGVRSILSVFTDGSPSRLRHGDIELFADVVQAIHDRFEQRERWRSETAKRKYDTEAVVNYLRSANANARIDLLYDLIGRGNKALLNLGDAQRLVRGLRTAA